jgi:hypothetical protein
VRIDWERVAEPQADGHDTAVVLDYVTTTVTPMRRTLHRRRMPGTAPTIFDGQVAVRYIANRCPGHPRHLHGPLSHPNIDQAVHYVRRWPEACAQFKGLMDSFHPMVDTTIPESEYNIRLGSNSHSDEDKFGTMYGTIFDCLGLAEAMVHEMAHTKLRGLGLYVETAIRLVTNPPTELYESPIRKDRPRPMTAVLHAQYSFIYVTQLDLKMIAPETDAATLDKMLHLLAANVPRMELGFEEVERNIQVDLPGRMFIDSFLRWSERVIVEGNKVLEAHGVPKPAADRI